MGVYAEGDRVRNTHYGYTGTVLQAIGRGRYLVDAEVGEGVTVKVEAEAGNLVPVAPVGRDETHAVCAACGRSRPRWTMASRIVDGSERFECSPKFALHCADCCKPGEYLTHYTYEEHEGHTLP